MTSLTLQLLTVAIITLQRQIQHNHYSSGPTPANNTQYDYIVVGAGTAGCVLAARLAENPAVNVLLLEAGGQQSVITDMPGNTLFLVGGEFDWNYHVVPQTSAGRAYPDFFISRGKVLGGSSVTNWDIYNRGNRRDYDNWAQMYGLTDWSFDRVLPYFLMSENNTDQNVVNSNSAFHNTNGLISVSTETIPDPVIVAFMKAANSLGIPIVDINGEQQYGTTIAQMFWNNSTGIKSTTANAYIERYNRTNLHVLTRAHVKRVLLERTTGRELRATGVLYSRNGINNLVVTTTREVIVSAGPINSPQVLMLSGIGPRDHLSALNIPVLLDLPVGNNLHDMVFVPLYYRIDNTSLIDPLPYFTIENLYNYYTSSSGPLAHHPDGVTYLNTRYNRRGDDWPDAMIIAVVEYFGDDLNATVSQYINKTQEWTDYWRQYVGGYYMALDPVLARPISRGTVRLNASNPYGPPLVDPQYLVEHRDFETILDAVRRTVYITVQVPLDGVTIFPPIPGCRLCDDMDICDDYLRCHVRQLARSYYNFVGTCRMGTNSDNNSVVDSRLSVKGVSNLRVVDASVIPEIPNGHTNAVTIMIAERAAQFIRENNSI
ncbi:L-sorbose 1-dehydrogenase-like [Oppia nitens]|uniref:L-sorbose 1-dehydrogenase-like n=1 Tax=Oppia nitens TaxID=1686743 RepID=UPI0023DC71E5|nr:L-sorbose 1-dehydrogenase-like [Oppia nitens]